MLKRIEIRNFKKIGNDGLVLDDLAPINYLVGENGSGKSSVLELVQPIALHFCKMPAQNITSLLKSCFDYDEKLNQVDITNLFKENYELCFEIRLNGRAEVFNWNKEQILSLTLGSESYSEFDLIYLNCPNKNRKGTDSFGNYNILSCDDVISRIDRAGKLQMSTYDIDVIEYVKNKFKKIVYTANLENKNSPQLDDDFVDFKKIAGGLQHIYILVDALIHTKKENLTLVLIDEPEINLHPRWQKLLPEIFNQLSKDYNIQFLISTHSPFIISAAGEFGETQKVYMLKEGEVMDKNEKKRSEEVFDLEAEKGYSGKNVSSVVAKMLGADFQDLGAPDNYIIVEEKSKKEFLETLFKRKEFPANIDIIDSTPGGDDGLINFKEKIDNLITINRLFIGNLVFSNKYLVFTDYVPEYFDPENETFIERSKSNNGSNNYIKGMNIKENLGDRFIALSDELEKRYPKDILDDLGYGDWDKSIISFNEYMKNKGKSKLEIKIEKSSLAAEVAKCISVEQFKLNFTPLYKSIFGDEE